VLQADRSSTVCPSMAYIRYNTIEEFNVDSKTEYTA